MHWLPWQCTAEPWIFVCSVCGIDNLVPSVLHLTFSLVCEAGPLATGRHIQVVLVRSVLDACNPLDLQLGAVMLLGQAYTGWWW